MVVIVVTTGGTTAVEGCTLTGITTRDDVDDIGAAAAEEVRRVVNVPPEELAPVPLLQTRMNGAIYL